MQRMKNTPKDTMLLIKASKAEHNAFKKLADSRHMNLSQLIRELLHRELEAGKKSEAA